MLSENISFIYKGDECILPWRDHGFELKFESGSLSRSVSEINIDISTNLPGDTSLPKNSILVSEIFTVQCKHEFLKNVSLKMEHFAEDYSNLFFATLSGKNRMFTLNHNGEFDESYGIIQTKSFSGFSIVSFIRNPKINCYAALYSKCLHKGSWGIDLYIVKNKYVFNLIEQDKELNLQGSRAEGTIKYRVDYVIMDISLSPEEIRDGWSLPTGIDNEMKISVRDLMRGNKDRAVVSFVISSTSNIQLSHAYNLNGAEFNSLCLTLHHTEGN